MSDKVSLASLAAMKNRGEKIVGMVVWDTHMAAIVDRIGVEIASVGDTVGHNLWGQANPLEITLDQMMPVCQAVRRGVRRALVSADFPFGPLQAGPQQAVDAAIRMVKEAGVDMIKLDGAAESPEGVEALVKAGIPVWAQFGITPQTALSYGMEYKSMNTSEAVVPDEMIDRLIEEAKMLESAGASLLDFTNSGPVVGPAVVAAVKIPVIGGFGGGPWLDGRVRMAHAAIGYSAAAVDSDAENYANVGKIAFEALTSCADDIRAGKQIKGATKKALGDQIMAFADVDGIRTHYDIEGSGPPLLMFAPGGFDATMDKWRGFGVYQRINLMGHLPKYFQCILFDRRENGASGGRLEVIGWSDFVRQAVGLLDHLGIDKAHLIGGCMGCSPVMAMAVEHPQRVRSMVHYWPVGGAHYRINAHQRFADHADFVRANGLGDVVKLVNSHDKNFSQDPCGGPWNNLIRKDAAFAAHYADFDQASYLEILTEMVNGLFDRDTAPGATAESLLSLSIPSLIVPGKDAAHATSAARYLEEVLDGAHYWDLPPEAQSEDNVPERLLAFLQSI